MCYFSKYVSKLSIFGSNVSTFDLGWRNSHFLCWTPTLHSCLHSLNVHTYAQPVWLYCSPLCWKMIEQRADPAPPEKITVPKYIHLHHHTAQKLTRLLGQRSSVITANLALLQPSRVFHLQGGREDMSHPCCSLTHNTGFRPPAAWIYLLFWCHSI